MLCLNATALYSCGFRQGSWSVPVCWGTALQVVLEKGISQCMTEALSRHFFMWSSIMRGLNTLNYLLK